MGSVSLGRFRVADKWLVVVAVTLGMLMSLMDSTIVNVAIPQMQRMFGADIQHVQWIVTIYMLTQAAVIPTAPYLTAKWGAKRVYVWTLSAFLLGSLLCGFAWDLRSLIFFRFIQGIGGGILLPMVGILLYQTFSTAERGTASSAMNVPLLVAPMLGPVVGGYLVTTFGWPWAFFINVPLGIVAVVIAQRVLPASDTEPGARFDSAGFFAAATGSTVLLYAASALTSETHLVRNVALLCGGIALLGAFVLIELARVRRGRTPLLDLRQFHDRTFAFSILALVFFAFVRFGLLFLTPIYLQTLRQQTALEAGMVQAALALATLSVLPFAGRLSDTVGPRPIVMVGLCIFAVATSLMMTLTLETPIWFFVGIMVLLGCASGFGQQISVSAMSNIEKDQRKQVANGSTLVSVMHATAAPLGVAVMSSIVQARSQQYSAVLSAQGVTGDLLQQQSLLLAMHGSFLVATVLACAAVVAMYCVPKRTPLSSPQGVQTAVGETHLSS